MGGSLDRRALSRVERRGACRRADETIGGEVEWVWIEKRNGEWKGSGFLGEKCEKVCTDERFFHRLSDLI